jgi:hypothetical protein
MRGMCIPGFVLLDAQRLLCMRHQGGVPLMVGDCSTSWRGMHQLTAAGHDMGTGLPKVLVLPPLLLMAWLQQFHTPWRLQLVPPSPCFGSFLCCPCCYAAAVARP